MMKCTRVQIGDMVAIVCGPPERARPCRYWEKPATKLCDAAVAQGVPLKTCDAPMCDDDAVHVGDEDFCVDHANEGKALVIT